MKVRIALLALLFAPAAACKSAPGKLPVDTPALPYVAPDADELAGVEPSDEDSEEEASEGTEPAPAPAPSPAPPPPAKK